MLNCFIPPWSALMNHSTLKYMTNVSSGWVIHNSFHPSALTQVIRPLYKLRQCRAFGGQRIKRTCRSRPLRSELLNQHPPDEVSLPTNWLTTSSVCVHMLCNVLWEWPLCLCVFVCVLLVQACPLNRSHLVEREDIPNQNLELVQMICCTSAVLVGRLLKYQQQGGTNAC